MKDHKNKKILIVGAGPTGLTTAIELAHRGVLATIVDQRDSASTLSRAVGITPRSLELLSQSDVANRLIAEGIPMDGLRVYKGQKLKLKMALRSNRAFHPNLICLAQDKTEAIMADVLKSFGVSVRYGVKLDELTQTPNEAIVKFNNGEEEKFDYIVGADGIRSTVRDQAGIAYPGIDLEQPWSIADVDLNGWQHPECLTIVQAKPGTIVVVVPLDKLRYRLIASHKNALQAMPLKIDVANVRHEDTFTISIRLAQMYSTGRVHLAGDAAHCHSPVGGRGMNLGIADAVNLAHRIVEAKLDGYSKARHQEALTAKTITERARKMSTGQNFARRIAFSTLTTMAGMLSPLSRKISSFIVEF